MKRLTFFSLIVISLSSLQFGCKSRSQIKSEQKATAPKTTGLRIKFNDAVIDTSITNSIFFIDRVDDVEGMAYGHIYQFADSESTELGVAAPYNCISYDTASKFHSLDIAKFVKDLNRPNNKSNVFINNKRLVGYTYRNIDKQYN